MARTTTGRGSRLFALLILALTLTVSGATSVSTKTNLVVRDIDGQQHNLSGPEMKASVLFFITNDCPIANTYASEIRRIVADYTPRRISFYAVYADPTISTPAIKQHAREFNPKIPLIEDGRHRLVDMVGATVTPEAVVLGAQGKVVYRGSIDDLYVDFGKRRPAPTRSYLRDALDALLSGKAVAAPRVRPIGCFIPPVNVVRKPS